MTKHMPICLFFIFTLANEVIAVSLTVSVAVVALLVGLSAGLILGVATRWIAKSQKQPSTGTPDIGQISHIPPAENEVISAGLAPVYEEIGIEETKDIPLRGNAAYGYSA